MPLITAALLLLQLLRVCSTSVLGIEGGQGGSGRTPVVGLGAADTHKGAPHAPKEGCRGDAGRPSGQGKGVGDGPGDMMGKCLRLAPPPG